ncbi:MAG: hypothetical protein ACWGPN_11555 [Gammaproteobacteria bacterium]
MSLFNAFAKDKHFSELADSLDEGGNIVTPATRRNRVFQNLQGLSAVTMGAGAGITSGAGAFTTSVEKIGDLIKTTIFIDLAGLESEATDGDIIGNDGSTDPAHLGQILAAVNGTIKGGRITCLEAPTTGEVDLNLQSAVEGTGIEGSAIGSLTATMLVDRNGDWANGDVRGLTANPAANSYLYLTVGTAATPAAGTYATGQFLIELYGQ